MIRLLIGRLLLWFWLPAERERRALRRAAFDAGWPGGTGLPPGWSLTRRPSREPAR